MKRANRAVVLVLAAMSVVISGGVSFQAMQAHARAERLSAEAVKKQDALRDEFRMIAELTAKAEKGLTDIAGRLEELRKREAPDPRRPGPPSLEQLIEFDPALKPVWDKRVRAKQEQGWAPMFLALGVSREDQEAFLTLQNEYSERSGDIIRAAEAQRMDLKHPAIEALLKQELMRTRELMEGRFGSELSSRIYEHWRTMGAREFADGLATQVAFTAPLSAEQATQLTQIVAEATPKYAAGDFADNQNVDWAAVERRLATILSPPQLAAWRQGSLRDPQGGRSREEMEMEAVYERVMAEEKKKNPATRAR
jgi:hypothetical protein